MGKESHQGRSVQRSNVLSFAEVNEKRGDVVITKSVSRSSAAVARTVSFNIPPATRAMPRHPASPCGTTSTTG